ncbi:ABC transporter substrate-binding protein [Roseomonas terrae]|jgi:peptide/nickel transport system substrate-binding protein|uniref:ABC transporter substrate-binding protein n=1 Tax=Neoroseomonas terrae TaxID=424799 RepID=A0ABS5EPF3_9PROT|nr:ABC transporter substrate-binding protein [Neoroseomonas terrae]MBR0652482.1 ABC transporter substrate-binding protein [Neoroseomonas terrae]
MIRFAAALGAALLLGVAAPPAQAQSRGDPNALRIKTFGDLRSIDPFISPEYMARNHGYMVYDTLFALDSRLAVRPQMVERWTTSEDGRTWTFTLREGLNFHDGAPVTSEDVIASLRRWAVRDGLGQQLVALATAMEPVDARSFRIVLREPFGLMLQALSKPSGQPPFIMPARVAATPPATPITDPTGSGPFTLRREDWRVGDRVTYRRNAAYVPRAEAPDGLAGGKRAGIERVEWVYLPDAQTALNALTTGEIDIFEELPPDLFPVVQRNRALRLGPQDSVGVQAIFRMNQAVPPFDNPRLRQAMRLLVDPAHAMPAYMTERNLWRDCRSFYTCTSPYHTEIGWVTPNLDAARRAVAESGYDGTPVVVLDAQDSTISHTFALVSADLLRQVGINVDVQAMDWATLIQRRLSRNPVNQGGWGLFVSAPTGLDGMDPSGHNAMRSACERTALPGWPCDAEMERIRDAFINATNDSQRGEAAQAYHRRATETVPYVPLGQFSLVRGYSARLQGILDSPVPVYWNISKAAQ